MATKMEVVLSPGNLGGDDGGPFRNEDVREWSRVDRITGMLERARVETGRWRANTRDAAQSYGKMIDSRERNSADGSLVQKARRQVEIFQSQGTSGRSFQVVRASQWSSSRATDISLDVPMTKPSTPQFPSESLNGTMTPTIPTPAPRLSLWRANLDNGASDLDRLSCLCRKLHDEAMNTTNLWSSLRARSPSPLSSLENTSSRFQEIEPNLDVNDDRLSTSSLGERRSNSTEDLSSLLNIDEAFARDCKTRRSLQVHNSENKDKGGQTEGERTRRRNEFIAERARRFEEGARESENGSNNGVPAKRNFISTKSFTSIADNEFVKSDPKHPSKFNQQFAKISIQDAVPASQTNGHTMNHHNHHHHQQQQHHHVVASPRLYDSPPAPAPRKANNKTVVHLRNAASPTAETAPPPRCINVTAIKLDNDAKDAETISENGVTTYGVLVDTSTKDETSPTTTTTTTAVVNGGSKPVKKVEFCKTEIHFAADSGKVNIVETDGKPPPTNKFRRRRRNSSVGAAAGNNAQKSNMPLVHFGDTSYEKYIFGGQGKLPQDGKKTAGLLNDGITCVEDVGKSYENGGEVDGKKDRWDTIEKVRDDGTKEKDNSYTDTGGMEKVGESNGVGGKYRGTHTTTVNFLSDESSNGNSSSVVPKVAEGKMRAKGIRLQFASTNRGLNTLASDDDDDEENCVSRTTKITVHLPPVISHHPRILQNNPFTNLKSVKLVMSIGKTATSNDGSLTLRELLSTLYSSDPSDGLMMDEDRSRGASQMWSLQLKSAGSSEDDRSEDGEGRRILDESRMLTVSEKPSNAFATTNHISTIQRAIEPVSTDKLVQKTPVLAKDPDSNQVLLKIVTTHKPMLARVENDHTPIVTPIPKPRTIDNNIREKSPPTMLEDEGIGLEAKDHCDTVNGTTADEAPTYENIFDALSSDGTPVYENFQVVGSKPLVVIKEKKLVKDKVPVKKRSSSVHTERTMSNDSYDRRHKKVSAKLSNGSSVGKPEKVTSSRSITPMSTLSKASSHSVDNGEIKRTNGISSRTNGSRDNSVKRYKDVRQDGTTRSNESRRRSSSSKVDPAMKDHKGTMSSVNSERNGGGSLRTKKPVEVVYQTAVFNMKNEKLSKPTKSKEVKGPRLINDLICGSKMRRPSDGKKAIKTAIVSQNTSKRKETPTTINR